MTHDRAHLFSSWNAGPRRTWVRRLCLIVVAALLVTGADLPSASHPVAAAPVALRQAPAAKPACPADRSDVASAAIAAKLCGAAVEAIGKRTETTRVLVNADGTITEEQALAPVRVKSGSTWRDVDLTLVKQADGSVAPRVHARGLRLSGAAAGAKDHTVVTLGSGGERTAMSWTGPLPEPVLDGPTATYPDVRRGLDLVIKAQTTGYEQFFVAHDRAALVRAEKLTLPLSTGALTARSDKAGGLIFTDAKGRTGPGLRRPAGPSVPGHHRPAGLPARGVRRVRAGQLYQ